VDDLLTYSKPVSSFNYYNQKLKDRIQGIRSMYEQILSQPHKFSVTFWYASKSDQAPNPKVTKRKDDLIARVNSLVTGAKVSFQFWGAKELTTAFRNPPNTKLVLKIVQQIMLEDGSVICLSKLSDFVAFLTNDKGALREDILELNVRDYQGKENSVNKQIRETIESSEAPEFWWLNNGITVLADDCGVAAGNVTIDRPELVNGLQTSHEIFNFFSKHTGKEEKRMVLVRVVLPPNDQARSRIIKATNNQTPVNTLSLRATEDIHFDIEESLKLWGVFYDRRKGEYRRRRKPIKQIVSIKELAQTIIAAVLQKPNDARGRPMTILSTNDGYDSVFNVKAPRDMFLACILLDRQVVAYLESQDDISRDVRNDIRFYMDTWLASHLTEKKRPTPPEIAAHAGMVKAALPVKILDECLGAVSKLYGQYGGDANAAKGGDMTYELRKWLNETYP
jgi:hypothetical protein